jgi:hypothetical protein
VTALSARRFLTFRNIFATSVGGIAPSGHHLALFRRWVRRSEAKRLLLEATRKLTHTPRGPCRSEPTRPAAQPRAYGEQGVGGGISENISSSTLTARVQFRVLRRRLDRFFPLPSAPEREETGPKPL